jgi:hypothetical protein
MRVFLGLFIGLLIGFGVAIFGYPLWEARNSVVIPKSDKVKVATSDAFYVCSTKYVKDRPLIIKSANGVAKNIILQWTEDDDSFTIEQTDDLNYTAYARREDGGFYILTLNRVTGDLSFADHPSKSAKDLLTDMCAKRVPWDQCQSRISSVSGGRKSECPIVVGEYWCPRLNNLGLISEVQFQCVPADRRF